MFTQSRLCRCRCLLYFALNLRTICELPNIQKQFACVLYMYQTLIWIDLISIVFSIIFVLLYFNK